MSLRELTVGKKLLLSVGSLLVMMIVLGLTSLNSITKLNSSLENSTQRTARRLILVGQIAGAGSDLLAGQRGVLMYSFAKVPRGVDAAKVLIGNAEDRWQKAI